MAKKKNMTGNPHGICNRAVIYARYSPGPNQREESIEGQIRECKEIAAKKGLMVIHEYIDKRLSGTRDDRPDFQRMLRDADRGLFDVLLVWKNDRFSRNRYDSAISKRRLKRAGVKIMYAKEHIPDGPEGIILESLLEGLAEYYSANLAQNIRRGQLENALEGKFIGGTIPLGYKLDAEKRYVIDPETAPLVREIFKRYVDGEAIIHICDDLNARGYQTARKKAFNRSSLHRILANEKYIGVYRFEDIEHKDAVPRIISDELFQAASLRAIKNKKSRRTIQEGQVDYLLTGKLFCGHCGESMGGSWGTSKSGTRHYYYVCNGKKTKKSACHKKAERKEDLEKLVVDVVIKNVLCNQAVVDFIIDRCMQIQEQDADTSAADGLRRELADAEKRLENLMTAIESGIITATTKARLVELEERCATLKQGIAEAEIRPPKFSREQLEFIFEKYQNRDIDDLSFIRDVIDTFVHAVYVYDNKLLITFNYSGDNTIEIPLSEIEKSVDSAGSQVFDFCGINSTIPKKLITGIIHCNQLFYFPILIILRPHRASP